MALKFLEMIELKGRNGGRDSWRFRVGIWFARYVLTALANDPQLRKELITIIRASLTFDGR
jgi:hypothetical protein